MRLIGFLIFLWSGALLASNYSELESAEEKYNEGVRQFRAGNLNDARSLFNQAFSETESRSLKARSKFNEGIIDLKESRATEALDKLKQSLTYDLENQIIQENLKALEQMLENQKEKQNQNGDQQQAQNQNGDQQQAQNQNGDQQQAQKNEMDEQLQKDRQGNQSMSQQDMADENQQSQGTEGEPTPQAEGEDHNLMEKKAGTPSEGEELAQNNTDTDQPLVGSKGATKEVEKRNISAQEIEIQKAEKLLRGVKDGIGRYYIRKKDIQERTDNGNEW